LILPASGPVYADPPIFIYSVERHLTYAPALRPLWEAAARGNLEVVSSELTLIGPLKRCDVVLEADYENFYVGPSVRLLRITLPILRASARHRAALSSLRTPDALHAATASHCGCTLFLTNDVIFRRITGLPVVILDDVVGP
jgi:predicted nucleic acid-binding protein